MNAIGRLVRQALPRGHSLDHESWRARHIAILFVLWAHVAAIPLFAMIRGYSLTHGLVDTLPVAVAAAVATPRLAGRRGRTGAATLGLFTASAMLVHLSGGSIEMHFHFFVMVPLVALYQDWIPFLVAVGYVLVHHGAVGAIDPASVYDHAAAWRSPWRWAAIHAFFISGASAVCLTTWRLNEIAAERWRRVEHELRHALSALSGTLEATADGILVVNSEGDMTNFNRRFAEMWSIPDDILRSRRDDEAIAHVLDQLVDPKGFLAKIRELYGGEAESFDELEFKDGRTFERYSHPQRVAGESVGRVWSFRDVTERRLYERSLTDALRRDHEAVQQLRALNDAKSLFLTAVSHELRTPLTSVIGFAQTLCDNDHRFTPERRRDALQRLYVNARRLERLILNIFDLDRLSRGILEPRREPTNLADLTRRVVANLDLRAHDVDVVAREFDASIDAAMIERVVENLIANAAKFSPRGSTILVRVTSRGRDALVSVEDRGPGVSDELKHAIFEPFRQGEIPAHSPGTGIGLSLVAQFVALHDGAATVEDRAGGGSRFVITLPAAVCSVRVA